MKSIVFISNVVSFIYLGHPGFINFGYKNNSRNENMNNLRLAFEQKYKICLSWNDSNGITQWCYYKITM